MIPRLNGVTLSSWCKLAFYFQCNWTRQVDCSHVPAMFTTLRRCFLFSEWFVAITKSRAIIASVAQVKHSDLKFIVSISPWQEINQWCQTEIVWAPSSRFDCWSDYWHQIKRESETNGRYRWQLWWISSFSNRRLMSEEGALQFNGELHVPLKHRLKKFSRLHQSIRGGGA